MGKDLKTAMGIVLRAKRERLAISQEEVAERAGVDRTYISILELGQQQPSLTTILKLAQALKCPAGKMLAQVELEMNQAASHPSRA